MNHVQTYIAFLRGINVGGHHKVPMAELRSEIKKMGFSNVNTVLNSGNIIFDGSPEQTTRLGEKLAAHLQSVFGFSIPVMVRNDGQILSLINENPFQNVEVTKDTRLYITFLKDEPKIRLPLPWFSADKTFCIINIRNRIICSVLDNSLVKTTKGMDSLEQLFGKNITTRNWNTLLRIAKKLY
jgi:uncharacterized protein (DUF1697 family)